MRQINKQPNKAIKYNKWVIDNRIAIDDGTKKWEDLPLPTKNSLSDSLLKEQGHICCFCGSRVYRQNSEIAHFVPQQTQEGARLIFDYDNLFASCNGGTNYIEHQNKQKCRTNDIASNYGVDKVYKDSGEVYTEVFTLDGLSVIYYQNATQKQEKYRLKNQDSYDNLFQQFGKLFIKERNIIPYDSQDMVNEGVKVIIYRPLKNKSEYHCNNRQGNDLLSFSLLNDTDDLEKKFYFDYEGLMIAINNQNLDNEINAILNLNSNYLCDRRKTIIRQIDKLSQEGFFNNDELRNMYIDHAEIKDNHLPVFSFVYTNELKRIFDWL